MIYIVLLFLAIVFSLRFDYDGLYNDSIGKQRAYFILFILLVSIAGFRYNIGGDTIGYAAKFDQYPLLKNFTSADISDINERFQPGWVLLASICRTIVDNFLLLQFIQVLIVNIILFRFFKKNSLNYISCVVIYYCIFYITWNTEILRGSMACVMGLLFYEALENKKYAIAVICGLASYLFHVSGIMVLFILLISQLRPSKKGNYIFLIICLIGSQLWAILPNNTAVYLNSLFGEANVDPYFNQEEMHSLNIFGMTLFYAKYLLLPILVIMFHERNEHKTKDITNFIWAYVFLIMLSRYSIAFNRMSHFFLPFYVIGMIDALSYLVTSGRIKKVAMLMLVFVSLYIYQVELLKPEDHRENLFNYKYERYYPYQSVFGDNSYK